MNQIKAVPRTYAGVRFRSTLEADWAYNLDRLGITWEYEPEAVQLPSGDFYRPDFYLPQCTTWLEVKGPHDDRLEKTRELAAVAYDDITCQGWGDEEFVVKVHTAGMQREAEEAIRNAPDGPTQVTVRTRRFDDTTREFVDEQAFRVRRRVRLTCAAAQHLRYPGDGNRSCCQSGSGTAWRMVVIGRSPVRGMMTWQSAMNYYDLSVIRCSDCGEHSFFDEVGAWTCRRCRAGGKVYHGGQWVSPVDPVFGGDHLPFLAAPRGAR